MEKNYFTVFGFDIYFYAVMIVSGIIAGAIAGVILCYRRGIKSEMVLNMLLAIIPLCIIGARLYYVIFKWSSYNSLKDIFDIRSGGLAIYGGVIGGALGVLIVCKICKVKFLRLADICAPCLILGQAIGRWGNFFNQEAYGERVTNPDYFGLPWSVNINGVHYQATFFYEFIWCLIGFILLFIFAWFYRKKADGLMISGYLVFYGIGRAVIEGFRTDSLYLWGTGIRVSQALSILMIIGGLILAGISLYLYYKKGKRTPMTGKYYIEEKGGKPEKKKGDKG